MSTPPDSSRNERARPRALILSFIFLSGASALTYEIVWVRQLSLIFGATIPAVSTVLGAYMAGLSLGSYCFGRWRVVTRFRPLATYLSLEVGIGLLALALPFAFDFIGLHYSQVMVSSGTSSWVFSLQRFMMLFSLLLLPTCLMGGTLPVITRLFVTSENRPGSDVGKIYGWNTLGATLGCMITGFWSIRVLGVANTTLVAALTNFIIAAGMAYSLRGLFKVPGSLRGPAAAASGPILQRDQWLVLSAIGLSGFSALAYEIVWTRLLINLYGGSIYAFTIMLAVFLASLAWGSVLGGRWADGSKNPLAGLAVVEITIGVLGVGMVGIFDFLPDLFLALLKQLPPDWAIITLFEMTFALALVLPTAFCFGMTFPYAVKAYLAGAPDVSEGVGVVYSVNTAGSIFGSLAAGFIGIALLGTKLTSNWVIAINLAIGIALIALTRNLLASKKYLVLLSFSIVLLPCQFFLPDWSRKSLVSGANAPPEMASDILFFEEDVTATISVTGATGRERSFQTNGKTEASTAYRDVRLLKMMGHLPMLVAPHPQEVLVIGLGAGMSAGATTLYPVDHVTVAELSAAVLKAARFFAPENADVMDNPNVKVVVDDGRNFLLANPAQYDVITSDPIHPWVAGSTNLYSSEHYQLCRQHLKKDGVMAQWLPLYQLSNDDYLMIAKTFAGVFPHSSLWVTGYDSFLVGSASPLKIDYASWQRKLAKTGVKKDLDRINLSDINELLSCFALDQTGINTLSAQAKVITDNHPHLEFSAPDSMYKNTIPDNLAMLMKNRSSAAPYLANVSPEQLARYDRHYQAKFFDLQAEYSFSTRQKTKLVEAYEKVISLLPENRHAPLMLGDHYAGEARIFQGLNDAAAAAANWSRAAASYRMAIDRGYSHPGAKLSLATALLEKGDAAAALAILETLAADNPGLIEAYPPLARAYQDVGKTQQAVRYYSQSITAGFHDKSVYLNLADIYLGSSAAADARSVLELGLKRYPGDCDLSATVGRVLEAINNVGAAERLYEKILADQSSCDKASENLGILAMNRGDWRKAERIFTAAARHTGKSYPIHYLNLGSVYYYGLQDRAAALRQFRTYCELVPGGLSNIPPELAREIGLAP